MTMEDSSVSRLSADAAPFYPPEYDMGIAIYNEGVPSLVITSEADLNQVLHGIQDESLDEYFPPNAQEAAELEAVDMFVETLALLAMMEDAEERARSFSHIKKRWAARRLENIKAHPARHMIRPAMHPQHFPKTTSIVPYSHHHRVQDRARVLHEMMRRTPVQRKMMMSAKTRAVIQQPVKQY
jgi:hypothetical protein